MLGCVSRLPTPDTENTLCCVNPGPLALSLSTSRMGLPLWAAQTEGGLMNFAQALMEVSSRGQWTWGKNKTAERMDKAANSPEFTRAEQTWHCSWNCLEDNFPSLHFSLTISVPLCPSFPWFTVSHHALQGSSRAIWSGIHKRKQLWHILCASFGSNPSLIVINFLSTQSFSK